MQESRHGNRRAALQRKFARLRSNQLRQRQALSQNLLKRQTRQIRGRGHIRRRGGGRYRPQHVPRLIRNNLASGEEEKKEEKEKNW
jgi:hypothetical protein